MLLLLLILTNKQTNKQCICMYYHGYGMLEKSAVDSYEEIYLLIAFSSEISVSGLFIMLQNSLNCARD